MPSIALSMITKDSYEKVGEYFEKVWQRSLQIPYNLIILIDDSETSKTRDFVKKFAERYGKELIVQRSSLYGWHRPTRATARQTAIDIFINNTRSDFLFFLDDDFILGDNWWAEAEKYIHDPSVGLIWGIDYTPMWRDRLRWLEVRNVTEREYAIRNFQMRGGLHDTLLRREAIEGIKIPPWAHVYEDAWVKKYVECRGYKAVIIDVPNVHLRRSGEGYSEKDRDIMLEISAMLRLEQISMTSALKALFGLPAYVYYSIKAYKSPFRGVNIWKERLTYRWKYLFLVRKYKNKDPCKLVSGI